jgi:hypothetical protein
MAKKDHAAKLEAVRDADRVADVLCNGKRPVD